MALKLPPRERILRLFRHEPVDHIPVFSGYGNITVHGMKKYGLKFSEIHSDARKMATMAATTYQTFSFECAVVPFDVCVEAEALGSIVNFYPNQMDITYPTIARHVAEKVADLELVIPPDLSKAGRIPLVMESIGLLKEEFSNSVAIGAWVLGPYTLAGQLVDLSDLGKSVFKRRQKVEAILDTLADVLIEIVKLYRKAGADYITVREMGAGPDILSPTVFEEVIMPPLKKVFAGIPSPKVLHMCGDTNMIVELMAQCGADALSVEKKNNVRLTRQKLGPDVLIFGDIDSYNVLVEGGTSDVDRAVKEAIEAGVDAVWPGCDIWPTVSRENMETLMDAVWKYGIK